MRPVIALVLLVGCGPPYRVDDSFASSIDLPLFGNYGDNRINSPYLRDASFQMFVVGSAEEIVGLSLESSDPDVLTIGPTTPDPEDDERRIADVQAVAPGSATVTVVGGNRRDKQEFEVRVADPDRLTLHPVARLVQEDESEDPLPTVVVGGRAEVEVHPYDGGALLSGSMWQAPASPEGLAVEASQYHASGLHDVLALTASQPGSWTLAMPYAGGSVDLQVDAVGPEAVTSLDVHCMEEQELEEGDTQYCLSTAALADGTDVYGVAPTWDLGGEALVGSGDLLLVTWSPGDTATATAAFGAITATASVSGTAQSVGSTNDVVACSSAGAAPAWSALLALGAALSRRVRRT